MTQNIECTNCHDIIELQGGRTITIPFVCKPSCLEVPPTNYEPSAEGEPELEDSIEAENTNLLFKDFCLQIEAAKQERDVFAHKLMEAENFINSEVDRSGKFLDDLIRLTQANAELNQEVAFLQTTSTKLLKLLLEKV